VQSLARIRADGGGSESLMSETRLQEVQTTRRKLGASGRGETVLERMQTRKATQDACLLVL
jgi:hypothetical protein